MPDAVYSEYWNNSWTKSYSYDSLGRLYGNNTKTQAGNWLQSYYYYKTISGNRTSTQVSKLETKIADFTYTYDNRGNITGVSDGTYTTTYTYDNLDQLIREDNPKINRTYVYTYSNGNPVSRSAYNYTAPGVTPTNVLQTYNWEYTAYTWKDLLVKYNGVSLAYDSNGQITSLNGVALSWHDLGLLGSAGSTTYTYDTSGKRLSKTVNGVTTNFYYAGDLLVGQKKGNEVIEFMFDSKGDYFGLEYNGTPYYYIKNLQGDVIAICNSAGNTVVTYEYDAWGRLMSYTDITGFSLVTKNPIRYRGYYLDHETGFYYLKSRYYSAEICRFLSPDVYVATGQGILGYNMFAYCNNNPIIYIDEYGTRHVKGTDACGISVRDEIYDVLSSENRSFYKNTPVIRHSIDFLTSWAYAGTIFLNHNIDKYSNEYKTQYLNHEYGHILQEKRLGTVKYTFSVAIPSAVYNLLSRNNDKLSANYYNMPWEFEADIRGSVDREHAN